MVDFKKSFKDKANVGFIMMGYPNLATSEAFLKSLDKKSKIDILELGVPYSDPLADGLIISEAAKEALEKGVNIEKIFKSLEKIKLKKPLVFLVYYNLIFSYVREKFVKKAKEVGISALIVPELVYEENEEFFKICSQNDMALVPLIATTTSEQRMKLILSRASGFVYAVASLGITGGKQVAKAKLKKLVTQIKKHTNLPVFVGFGIKNSDDVNAIKALSDGAIVGTSIIEAFKNKSLEKIHSKINEIFS